MRWGQRFDELHACRGKYCCQVLQHSQYLLVCLVLERGEVLSHVAHKVDIVLLTWSKWYL